jgi:hypothetical protein
MEEYNMKHLTDIMRKLKYNIPSEHPWINMINPRNNVSHEKDATR